MMPSERFPLESRPSSIPPKTRAPEDFTLQEVVMFIEVMSKGTLELYSFDPDTLNTTECIGEKIEERQNLTADQAREIMSQLWELYNDPDFQLAIASLNAQDNQN